MNTPRITLIEDNPADVRLIREQFKELQSNCSFFVCRDGEEAYQHFSQNLTPKLPHLIILDINMPRMSGIELLKEIKLNESVRQVPVVIFSSSSSKRDIKVAYQLGASSYVVKPFDFNDFNDAIYQIWNYWFRIVKLPVE